MKFTNLDFLYLLPYCELSFCHRDHYRVSNYHFWAERFKSGLRFKKNVPCGLSNHSFVQLSQYWEGVKDQCKSSEILEQCHFKWWLKYQNDLMEITLQCWRNIKIHTSNFFPSFGVLLRLRTIFTSSRAMEYLFQNVDSIGEHSLIQWLPKS